MELHVERTVRVQEEGYAHDVSKRPAIAMLVGDMIRHGLQNHQFLSRAVLERHNSVGHGQVVVAYHHDVDNLGVEVP